MFAAEDGIVFLADWAVGGDLHETTAAQLGFEYEEQPPFCGRKGRSRLVVIDGLVNPDVAELLVSALGEGERLVLCATAVDPDTTPPRLDREEDPGLDPLRLQEDPHLVAEGGAGRRRGGGADDAEGARAEQGPDGVSEAVLEPELIDEERIAAVAASLDLRDPNRRALLRFCEEHRDEITALQILYARRQPQRLTFREVKELAQAFGRPPYQSTPDKLWDAYEQLDRSRVRGSGERVLTDLVSLVRVALHQENELVPYPDLVRERFHAWLLQQENTGRTFDADQLAWLERIRDHVSASLAITTDDFNYVPFVEAGGLGRAAQVFGDDLSPLLDEINEALTAPSAGSMAAGRNDKQLRPERS